ncbi:uncharacterized protein LOC108602134 [Drosophila busckii]|nr:uncharacterized protein LOC108602134 [Drosophila busckii]
MHSPENFYKPTKLMYKQSVNKNVFKNEMESIDEVAIFNKRPVQKYYVKTKVCKIPYIPPFTEDLMKFYKPKTFETCSNETDLVQANFDEDSKSYRLYINETLAAQKLNSTEVKLNCYYEEITRYAEHDSYNDPLPRIYFSQGYEVPLHVQGMMIHCYEAANETNIVQSDAYAFIQYKPMAEKPQKVETNRQPSVIMFGIDSTSRINVRRTMPQVFKFLRGPGWYEMQGYNKVGDNTFPNLMAILSGYLPDSAKAHVCDTSEKYCFDRFPFIWKHLKAAGYLTAYAEDSWSINTFNYVKPGFVEQPTDYYFRPFLRAFDAKLDTWKCAECSWTYCMGRRLQTSYIYDYGRDFTRRYIKERPIWGLFWTSSFSHDDYSMPSKMDKHILEYLLDFKKDGVLDESIVIFFSDHGARYGRIMDLDSAFLEERLPMMFIYLPTWFREQYPEFADALYINQHRLSSNFDLHNTLIHILQLGRPSEALPLAHDCPKCHSLFYPIDEQRRCVDAAISEHYCTCEPYKRLHAKWADRIAPRVIEHINDYLWARNFSSLCVNLTLHYIHKTEMKMSLDRDFFENDIIEETVYRTKFKVMQNSADFYATVLYNNVTDQVTVDVETISRTNSYDKDSTCLNDKLGKLYCICMKDLRS